MKILLFYHSLLSDWNHGNAHFLRGLTTELLKKGHDVQVYEPRNGWSYAHWKQARGEEGLQEFKRAYPQLTSHFYEMDNDFDTILREANLVIVHEWNEPELVKLIGEKKAQHSFKLLFHDTHHRSVTAAAEMKKYDLSAYDGVLAFGNIIRDIYLENQWTTRAWTFHEAADTNVFKPIENVEKEGDLVWIGNWGDDERTEELNEFLIEPVQKLGLKATMYGVRYPKAALQRLEEANITYGGYLPTYQVPEVFARYRMTVHVPRRPYTRALPGIPTIRPFEALACGIPLLSAPWQDVEQLFRKDTDFLMVNNGDEMQKCMQEILEHPEKAAALAKHGLETIRARHTCLHRADELLAVYEELTNQI